MSIINSSLASGILSFVSMLINTSRGKLRTLILFSLFLCAPSLANAVTYYVAPSGSNSSPGTQAAPFATLQKAQDVAVAGDTIYMRGGTYRFSSPTTITRDGTSGNLIKVFNFTGETPVIDAINQAANSYPIYLQNANFWHIKGLEVKNGVEGGIRRDNSSNNIIENNNVHHNGRNSSNGTGIRIIFNSANNLLLNNDSHHNRGEFAVGNADGFDVASTATGNVVRGNRAWRNSDDGIDYFNPMDGTNSTPVLTENNWSFENGYDDNGNALGNGMGFKLGGVRPNTGGSSGAHTLKNNLSWKNRNAGFDDACSACTGSRLNEGKPLTLYNNTAWNNGHNFAFWHQVANVFRNNSSFGPLGSISGSDTFNSWTLGVNVSAADFSPLDDTIARGPRKADGSLPSSNFLRLAAGSDLIDRGVNVGIPYTGSAPDLGAYEYGGSVTPPPPPAPPPPPPTTSLPDVVVTSLSYANGIFTSTVKNKGTAATPSGVAIGVRYSVDGVGRTWGAVNGPLAAGASVTVGTNGGAYTIPTGAHTYKAYADDVNRFAESDETNNQLETNTSAPPAPPPPPPPPPTTSLPDVVVTSLSYASGVFTSTVKNQGTAATPAGIAIGVGYSVDGVYRTWGAVNGPLAAGASVTIGTNGGPYTIPTDTHTITAHVDDNNRFAESNETNNQYRR